ncbi:MAG: hypothetical protein QM535_21930 [Limnohabitans sp.]|nr:hypothetical protein [Limnohabitans sp.]
MSTVKKVAVVPFEQIQNGKGIDEIKIERPKMQSIKERQHIKMINLLRIMSRLANIHGYDENGKILDRSGKYMDQTDIAVLLLNAMSPGKLIIGEDEFIYLLKKANVNPDLILNENVRYKLLNERRIQNEIINEDLIPETQIFASRKEPLMDIENNKEKTDNIEPRKVVKRKLSDDILNDYSDNINDESFNSKRKRNELPDNWIVPEEE